MPAPRIPGSSTGVPWAALVPGKWGLLYREYFIGSMEATSWRDSGIVPG